ncbi:MAG TPA: hypothetical protein GXZ64_07835 [Clostridiaceae bacterium]|jgi:hypothetical protein|nr:hypothetical protein [Clostridiaceae bacterium]
MKKPKEEFVDDGRVIADMDMPGVRKSIWDSSGVRINTPAQSSEKLPRRLDGEMPWTKKEMFYFYLGSVASVLLYGLIIFGGLALFLILWLR